MDIREIGPAKYLRSEQLLLVEDSLPMQMVVQAAIGHIFPITCVTTLADARRELAAKTFSLVLLDVGLPDGDGFDLCLEIRGREDCRDLPVIFLTGEADVDRKAHGFSIGGDDYIVKPLEPKEFRARVEAKLARRAPAARPTSFTKAKFRVDMTAHKVFLATDDGIEKELGLTPIEYKLLAHFLSNEGKTFPREELLTIVWGETVHVSPHTVDTHISSLRKKIGKYGPCIKAVVKQGYCFSLALLK